MISIQNVEVPIYNKHTKILISGFTKKKIKKKINKMLRRRHTNRPKIVIFLLLKFLFFILFVVVAGLESNQPTSSAPHRSKNEENVLLCVSCAFLTNFFLVRFFFFIVPIEILCLFLFHSSFHQSVVIFSTTNTSLYRYVIDGARIKLRIRIFFVFFCWARSLFYTNEKFYIKTRKYDE